MKKTPPVGMGSVDFSKYYTEEAAKIMAAKMDAELKSMIYGIAPLKPEADVAITMTAPKIGSDVKRRLLHSVVMAMLPQSELYEWHVRGEVDLATLGFRLDIGLSDKYPKKGPPIRLHASQMIADEDLLYNDRLFLQTVVDNLVDKIVHEVAKLERQRRIHDEQTKPVSYDFVSREAEWEVAEVDPTAGDIRTSTASST